MQLLDAKHSPWGEPLLLVDQIPPADIDALRTSCWKALPAQSSPPPMSCAPSSSAEASAPACARTPLSSAASFWRRGLATIGSVRWSPWTTTASILLHDGTPVDSPARRRSSGNAPYVALTGFVRPCAAR